MLTKRKTSSRITELDYVDRCIQMLTKRKTSSRITELDYVDKPYH